MASLIECKTCKGSISEEAKSCPKCGQPDPKPSGCFVATAVYGSYDHPIVLDFRKFRDNWLKKKSFGQKFINWYYSKGPYLAEWVGKSKLRKFFVLQFLLKPVHLIVKLFKLHS
jgi:hypothetical protein